MKKSEEVFVPHVGWFLHEPGDDVAQFLEEGWFEYREQAFVWLYARPGDVFIDCGAHFGLYSALYTAAANRQATVWAIEPNTATLRLLKKNLALHGCQSTVLACAVAESEGQKPFYLGETGKAAYSGLTMQDSGGPSIEVASVTLDRVCSEHGISSASFVKFDIEGSEVAALRGASASIAAGILPVMMVEFTELNLQRSGLSTKDLISELESRGYTVCRFDEETLALQPVQYTGPVWYDNYFAVLDLEAVNTRLRQALSRHQRIARDILRRGRVADRVRTSESLRRADAANCHTDATDDRTPEASGVNCAADEANRRADDVLKLLNEAYARAGEANWRGDEANRRADDALKLLKEAYARAGEANWRGDEANRRADDVLKLLNEAYARTGEANWRGDEASRRADDVLKLLKEAYARTGEANWRGDEANRRADDALKLLNEAYARTGEANWRGDEANRRADDALKLLNEAYARTGEANWRGDEANRRADDALKLLNEAYARTGEANWRGDEANRRADDALKLLNEACARADEANRRADNAMHLADEAKRHADAADQRAAETAAQLEDSKRLLAITQETVGRQKQTLERLHLSKYVRLGRRLHLLAAASSDRDSKGSKSDSAP